MDPLTHDEIGRRPLARRLVELAGGARAPWVAVALALAWMLAVAPEATASSVSVSGGVLVIEAAEGERNDVAVGDQLDLVLTVADRAGAVAGAGCWQVAAGEAWCFSQGVTSVRVRLNDGGDSILYRANLDADLDTGSGDDAVTIEKPLSTVGVLVGAATVATVRIGLGHGNDNAKGWFSDDVFDGGPGDDRLEPDGGRNVIAGGAGSDTVSYEHWSSPVVVDLDGLPGDGPPRSDGAPGMDTVAGDVENVVGGRADDTLTGNSQRNSIHAGSGDDHVYGMAGDDELAGEEGNDVLDGGLGRDVLVGGAGDDTMLTDDGESDRSSCGEGIDLIHVDDTDAAAADCEVQSGSYPATIKGTTRYRRVRASSTGRVRLSWLTVGCPSAPPACRVSLDAWAVLRSDADERRHSGRGSRIGRHDFRVAPGDMTSARFTLTRRGVTALRRARRLRTTIKITARHGRRVTTKSVHIDLAGRGDGTGRASR